MDNEREVKHLVEKSKMLFLQGIIEDFRRRQSQYDLGTEFAKTKKNRTILVPAVVGVLVLFFALSAVAITWYTEARTADIMVSIDEFADVDLRELLDSARRLDAEMDLVQRQRAELIRRRDREIAQVEGRVRRDIDLLANRDLTEQQRSQQAAQIRADEESQVEEVEAMYAEELDELNLEIEALTTQMAQYDARQVEQAEESEAQLDSQRRLFELEMEEQATEYEQQIEQLMVEQEQQVAELENFVANLEEGLRDARQREINALIRRYNPQFEEGEVAEVLLQENSGMSFGDISPPEYSSILADEGILSEAEFSDTLQDIREFHVLIGALRAVPYRNSVPDILEGIESRAVAVIWRYEALRQGYADAVARRDEQIEEQEQEVAAVRSRFRADLAEQRKRFGEETERFLVAMEALTSDNRENGYIIDARNHDEVYVFMDRLHELEIGGQGYVFRRDDELLAVIEFIGEGSPARARVVELYEDMGLRPFDRVLLQLQ
ncbi:MAG: hypothetical protein LC641_07745 [Spirochaeta sp.]|nr:hypothetical protein [Spirochaeta sp.]